MGFKFGLIAGLAAGYVLGTRHGRERYEQILEATHSFVGSETARSLEGGLRDAWDRAQHEWPALRSVEGVVAGLAGRDR